MEANMANETEGSLRTLLINQDLILRNQEGIMSSIYELLESSSDQLLVKKILFKFIDKIVDDYTFEDDEEGDEKIWELKSKIENLLYETRDRLEVDEEDGSEE
jgi:preprotein translocase subunit SecA